MVEERGLLRGTAIGRPPCLLQSYLGDCSDRIGRDSGY